MRPRPRAAYTQSVRSRWKLLALLQAAFLLGACTPIETGNPQAGALDPQRISLMPAAGDPEKSTLTLQASAVNARFAWVGVYPVGVGPTLVSSSGRTAIVDDQSPFAIELDLPSLGARIGVQAIVGGAVSEPLLFQGEGASSRGPLDCADVHVVDNFTRDHVALDQGTDRLREIDFGEIAATSEHSYSVKITARCAPLSLRLRTLYVRTDEAGDREPIVSSFVDNEILLEGVETEAGVLTYPEAVDTHGRVFGMIALELTDTSGTTHVRLLSLRAKWGPDPSCDVADDSECLMRSDCVLEARGVCRAR